ncbi:3',5'-cyclic-AMP phosphodiesterase [Geitlerinema sp. PCC 9228]|jgi:Icc protein|uniref:3',5'-cyclic-AMP phosphodiesterase n=1 Tax=Geitlerinema sp. PCC 9228 TaxID=111611 RepID=UPI0008F99541|nr:3',5'-cyclic-AMP phosphodiesterase [Geitlerinema sp. PCC 9228]
MNPNSHSALVAVQITDTHLFASESQKLKGVNTAKSLQTVLHGVQQLQPKPDMLLLTGDLSQDETMDSYQRLYDAIAPLQIPTYWLAGNHDCFAAMQPILSQPPFHPQKSFQLGGWQFLLLPSQVPGWVGGKLSADTLTWLDRELQQCRDRPTLVAVHHPPFLVNTTWVDGSTLENPEEFWQVLDKYPQVRLAIAGHIHQEFAAERQGVQYLATPSTCIQFAPFKEPFSSDRQQPGFRVFYFYPDGTWHTQVQRVRYAAVT